MYSTRQACKLQSCLSSWDSKLEPDRPSQLTALAESLYCAYRLTTVYFIPTKVHNTRRDPKHSYSYHENDYTAAGSLLCTFVMVSKSIILSLQLLSVSVLFKTEWQQSTSKPWSLCAGGQASVLTGQLEWFCSWFSQLILGFKIWKAFFHGHASWGRSLSNC